nr:acyltransferase [Desulfobacula sp.]
MTNRFDKWEYPEIIDGKPTKHHWVVQGSAGLTLGYKTDIGAFTYINAHEKVVIEDFVQLGSHCSVYSVSTIDGKKGKVTLKKNCCVGSHSTIMPGITIGENSIVGAHSFVNKDIPDNVIAFGTPVKIIKSMER